MSFSKMYSMSYYVSKLKSPDSSDIKYKVRNTIGCVLQCAIDVYFLHGVSNLRIG
jgi:hypothetical protein